MKRIFALFLCMVCGVAIVARVFPRTETIIQNASYVDLGLPSGTLWASANLGANTCADGGALFSFSDQQNAQCCLPTAEQWEELFSPNYCYVVYDAEHQGIEVKSRINGASLFLPAAGLQECEVVSGAGQFGFYWSSETSAAEAAPYFAFDMRFETADTYEAYPFAASMFVRQVCNKQMN